MKKYTLPPATTAVAVAAALVCLAFTACQKQIADSSSPLNSTKTTAGIGPLGPPSLLIWTHPTDIPMPPPSGYYIGKDQAQGFAINGKGYIFCGRYDSKEETALYLPDLWEYDPSTRTWTQKADFPGGTNIMGCHFVIGSKVYVVIDNKCWAWDQTTNAWTVKASIPSHRRLNASAFAIKKKGYVGLGDDEDAESFTLMKDWWEYNSTTDTWTKKNPFHGAAREYAPAFSIGDYGYVCGGNKATDRLNPGDDLWRYDPSRDSWTEMAAPPATGLAGAIGVSGVVDNGTALGFVVQGMPKGCLQYNPATNAWQTLPDVPGARYFPAGFMIGRSLYVAGGTAPGVNGFRKDVEALTWSN